MVNKIFEGKDFNFLTYPPNEELTDEEIHELRKIRNNNQLKSALKKLIADNSASVIFSFLNHIDGTTDPKIGFDDWTGLNLQNLKFNEEGFEEMTHSKFFEIYETWRDMNK